MRDSMQEVIYLLNAKTPCIWIDTYEELNVVEDIAELLRDRKPNFKLYTWTTAEGLAKIPLSDLEEPMPTDRKINIEELFRIISANQAPSKGSKNENIYIIKDFHLINDTGIIKRALRDCKEKAFVAYNPIIVIAPVTSIPIEHEKLFSVVHYDTPDKAMITTLVEMMVARLTKNNEKKEESAKFILPTPEDTMKIINACIGLTYNEIMHVLRLSAAKYRSISLQAILDEKVQLVEKSGVLDYKLPNISFDDVGGNNAFKKWMAEVELSMTEAAKEFGCQKSKGYLALGIPGTARQ